MERLNLTGVELHDGFWAPRQAQVRDHTLEVLLDRFESHGAIDNFRRLGGGPEAASLEHRGWWFTDSDAYKWMEASAWAGRFDLLEPVVAAVLGAQRSDGYLHSYYGDPLDVPDGGAAVQPRYSDLVTGHELYCFGHFIEAALAADSVGHDLGLLEAAVRLADHVGATFGPGLDERTDAHPEIELALVRLAARTGQERFVHLARWMIDTQLAAAGLTVATVDLAGHAVRALYLASGIAEVALATGAPDAVEATERLFATLVTQRSYETGAVGGRWLGEAAGRPYELPAAMSYAESCAAVAATQFCSRVHRLTGEVAALDQIEVLLHNAVPCGVGAGGDTWFYSQPHAVEPGATETNPWVIPFDYGQAMLLEWFPPRRHDWFEVTCCPPNLARMFAGAHHHVASLDASGAGELRVHLPLSCRITAPGWDVTVEHTANPRKELEEHYYNAKHQKLLELGLRPTLLGEELIDTMLDKIRAHQHLIDPSTLIQNVRWVPEPHREPVSV